jgi:hypothetical protein
MLILSLKVPLLLNSLVSIIKLLVIFTKLSILLITVLSLLFLVILVPYIVKFI